EDPAGRAAVPGRHRRLRRASARRVRAGEGSGARRRGHVPERLEPASKGCRAMKKVTITDVDDQDSVGYVDMFRESRAVRGMRVHVARGAIHGEDGVERVITDLAEDLDTGMYLAKVFHWDDEQHGHRKA